MNRDLKFSNAFDQIPDASIRFKSIIMMPNNMFCFFVFFCPVVFIAMEREVL